MLSRIFVFVLALVVISLASGPGHTAGSPVVNEFVKALDAKDAEGMSAVVTKYKMYIPATIKSLLDEALKPGVTDEKKEENFYLAELIANKHKELSGDTAPLIDVKKAVFHSKLGPAVRSVAKGGVHVVNMPEAKGEEMNVFKPDNIIIKVGETVRWVNKDKIAHVFSSMPVIGMGGIFVPSIEPGATYDYKFEKPGEYYYICFIHKGMVGKITVEGTDNGGNQPTAPASETP